jgi:hypothetical protein
MRGKCVDARHEAGHDAECASAFGAAAGTNYPNTVNNRGFPRQSGTPVGPENLVFALSGA